MHLSQVFSRLVLGFSSSKVVLQEALQVLKGVPLVRILPPALQHQLMQRCRAALRTGHSISTLHLLQNLSVVHPYTNSYRQKQKEMYMRSNRWSTWVGKKAHQINLFFILFNKWKCLQTNNVLNLQKIEVELNINILFLLILCFSNPLKNIEHQNSLKLVHFNTINYY